MSNDSHKLPIRNVVLLSSAFFAFLAACYVDLAISEVPLLAEGPPCFDQLHMLRTVLMALVSGAVVIAVASLQPQCQKHGFGNAVDDTWTGWGTVAWSTDEPNGRRVPIGVKTLTLVGIALLCQFFLLLFCYCPVMFYKLAWEGKPVETLSALPIVFRATIL